MLQFSKEDVLKTLTPAACIAAMRGVLLQLEQGGAKQYLRTVTPLPTGNIMGYMPAFLGEDYFGAKLITVFHTNSGTGFPSHQGSVLLFDTPHGSLLAMADGDTVTSVRTGAVSAVATDLLAKKDAKTLCLIGAGEQARSHLAALREVRRFEEVKVWDKVFANAAAFAEKYETMYGIKITPCETAQAAVTGADVICTLTPSHTPVLETQWVAPGAHINAVGACFAKDRELPSALVANSKLYCDAYESILAEAGDFLYPKEEGLIDDSHILGTIGGLLAGTVPARENDGEITIFEALGLAVEDVASAKYLYENALRQEK